MTSSREVKTVLSQIDPETTKLGDLRKIAKEIKIDHELALGLWESGDFFPRMLALLIMDKKNLTQDVIDNLADDIQDHDYDQRNQLADWLLANQLNKSKRTSDLINTWENSPSPTLRRIYWFHQGRLRWSSKAPPDNTGDLLTSLEQNMNTAELEVQRMMNFAAAQIGIHEPAYRERTITLGEKLGLYIDEPVPKNCTSPYLPLWIETEVEKLK